MYGRHPNALGTLLDDGRVLCLTSFGIVVHTLHEDTKRRGTTLLEASGQINHPQAVGQGLLAGQPHRNARMGTNRVHQHQYRLGNWATIAFHVQSAQQNEGIGDFLRFRRELASINWMHRMESTYLQLTVGGDSLSVCKQSIVAERE
jgi:hypothetical protein